MGIKLDVRSIYIFESKIYIELTSLFLQDKRDDLIGGELIRSHGGSVPVPGRASQELDGADMGLAGFPRIWRVWVP